MASCEANRTLRDGLRLSGLFERMSRGIGVQVLRNALANQQQRINQRGGQQHVKQGTRGVHPEVADGARNWFA